MLLLALPAPAFAACTNPAGVAGQIVYNADFHVPQYCNGTQWIGFTPNPGSALAASTLPVDGLVGYWNLDESAGTTANDSAGSNDGTLINSPVWQPGGGIVNGALDWTGSDQAVNLGSTVGNYTDNFTISLWFKRDNSGPYQTLFARYYHPNLQYMLRIRDSSWLEGVISLEHAGGGANGTTYTNPGEWYHAAVVISGSNSKLYLNGVQEGPTFTPTINAHAIDTYIGARRHEFGDPFDAMDGLIDEVRLYNRALSGAEIAALASAGCANPRAPEGTIVYNESFNVLQFCNGAEWIAVGSKTDPFEDDLVGHWKFDEMVGTTAADSSGQGNNGTLVNMESADWVAGVSGGALSFDGTNEYVEIGDVELTNNELTLSGWAYFVSGSGQCIVCKYQASGNIRAYGLMADSSSISAVVSDDGNTGAGSQLWYWLDLGANANLGKWRHFAMTYNGTGTVESFVDGVSVGTSTDAGIVGLYDSTRSLRIGNHESGGEQYFGGRIDDVRIHKRKLTAAEVKALYQATAGDYRDSSLLAHWPMDEGTGTTTADASGNGETGTLTGTTWTTEAITGGQALSFDGTTSYITIDQDWRGSLQSYSVAMWLKPVNNGLRQNLFQELHGESLYARLSIDFGNGGDLRLQKKIAGVSDLRQPNANLQGGVWQHLVVTFDQPGGNIAKTYVNGTLVATDDFTDGLLDNDDNNDMQIGYDDNLNEWYRGVMDDVRVYNRPLSAGEVKSIYDATARDGLIAHYPFDETSGTTANDFALGNDGTLNGFVADPWEETGGKINGALTFAAGSDYVAFPSTNFGSNFSFAFWLYPIAGNDFINPIVANSGTGWNTPGFRLFYNHDSAKTLGLYFENANGSNAADLGYTVEPALTEAQWNHVVVSINRSAGSMEFYVNGETKTADGTIRNDFVSSGVWQLGAMFDGVYELRGKMDDFRVYNRTLTAAEAIALYNETKAGYGCSPEGQLRYNSDKNVMEYCDGTNWIGIGDISCPSPGRRPSNRLPSPSLSG